MNKFFLFTFLVFTLLNLSCNDKYDFSNPLDSQSIAILQAPTNLSGPPSNYKAVRYKKRTKEVAGKSSIRLNFDISKCSNNSFELDIKLNQK